MKALHDGTYRSRDARTVADVLGLDAQASGRSAAPYDPTHEVRPATRTRGMQRRSAAEVDARLVPFLNDALVGVPDRLLAERTDLEPSQVKQWRARRRIRARRGRAPAIVGAQFLIGSLLGEATEPVPHEISPVDGAWRPPVYALRRPLQYDLFVRAVSTLASAMTSEEIALAIGIDERDVAMALALSAERGAS